MRDYNCKKYLILPGCDDQNRGDQALIWETVDIAMGAGYKGRYYILAEKEKAKQSLKQGIYSIDYILKHPSRIQNNTKNINYTKMLKIKWGIVAILDFLKNEPLISPVFRGIFYPFLSQEVKNSLRIFKNSEVCFVKGGGFLHAHGGLVDTYKIYYFLYHIRLALSYGKRVYIMPNSFGPFKSPGVRWMMFKTLSKCQSVMSREQISQKQLEEECGISSLLFTDIAFHLQADKTYDAEAELLNSGIPLKEKKCVGITLRPYRFPGEENPIEKYELYKQSIAKFVEWISLQGLYPVLIEHVFDENDHERDIKCIEDVQTLLGDKVSYTVFSNRKLTCNQMKKIYSQFDYIIGTRFHSVIFSLSEGIPAIAITYGGNKGLGIMKDLGLSDYSIPISDLTYEKLVEMFLRMKTDYAIIKKKIDSNMISIKEQKYKIIEIIKE